MATKTWNLCFKNRVQVFNSKERKWLDWLYLYD